MKYKDQKSEQKTAVNPTNTKIHLKVSEVALKSEKYEKDKVRLFYAVVQDNGDQYFNSLSEHYDKQLQENNKSDLVFSFKERCAFQLENGFEQFTLKVYSVVYNPAI